MVCSVYIAFTAKENIGHYSLFRNWMFFFQRVSGILAFVLLQCTYGKHVCKKLYGKSVDYNLMHETLQHPLWAIFYIICVIAVVFHFANGLWSFCVTWGFYNLKNHNVFYLDFTHSIFSDFLYWCCSRYCVYISIRIFILKQASIDKFTT